MVFGVVAPVLDVDVRKTGDEELELLLVEDGDEVCWDDVMEACANVSILSSKPRK